MQKLFAILLSLVVSMTYVGATILSQSHHHHNGTICLKAAAMNNCCDNTAETAAHGGQPCKHDAGQNCNHEAGEDPGCTYNAATLTAAQQRTTENNVLQHYFHNAVPTAITQEQTTVEAKAKIIIPINSDSYTPPNIKTAVPLRAPPYTV